MKKVKHSSLSMICILFTLTSTFAQLEPAKTEAINSYVADIIKDYEIYGGAIAVLQNNEVLYKRTFGIANIEKNTAVDDNSIFPIFSTTKIFTAVAAHKLLEEGRINLEDPISKYLNDIPDTWKTVQIKHLLSFSSGLPDINRYSNESEKEAIKKVYADTLRFQPGARFDYNQSNGWLLNRVVKKVTKKSIPDVVLTTQFNKNSQGVIYDGIYSNKVSNRATVYAGYGPNGPTGIREIAEYNVADFVYAGSGLNISIDRFIAWEQGFYKEKFISNKTKEKLFEVYKYETPHYFSYGWSGIVDYKGEVTFGFTGSGFTGYRVFPKDNITVIILTNGSLHIMPINGFINRLAEIVSNPIAQTDKELITQTINDYMDGTASGIPARIRRAFHEDLNLYAITNDTLSVTNGNTYIGYFRPGQKRNRIGKIITIDYVNDAAMAKLEIDVPYRNTLYTDYLLLLKIEGHWKIIQKSYTAVKY